jgi:hypothetical protein
MSGWVGGWVGGWVPAREPLEREPLERGTCCVKYTSNCESFSGFFRNGSANQVRHSSLPPSRRASGVSSSAYFSKNSTALAGWPALIALIYKIHATGLWAVRRARGVSRGDACEGWLRVLPVVHR